MRRLARPPHPAGDHRRTGTSAPEELPRSVVARTTAPADSHNGLRCLLPHGHAEIAPLGPTNHAPASNVLTALNFWF